MRLLKADRAAITKTSKGQTYIPHLSHSGFLRRFNDIRVLAIAGRGVALATRHEEEVLHVLEGGLECARLIVICHAELQAEILVAGPIGGLAGGRNDRRRVEVVFVEQVVEDLCSQATCDAGEEDGVGHVQFD